jgi:hypothetical protein
MVGTAVATAATAAYSANQQKHALEDQAKVQQQQTDQSAMAQTDDRIKAAREQRAAARAASAESGASGNSTDAILNDIMMQSGRDVSRIEKNRENGQIETQQQARSRTAEINGQLVTGLVGAASQGASAYSSYKANYIPKIPDAGQHAPPRVTMDRQQFTIGK